MDQPTKHLTGPAAILVLHFEEKLLPKAFELKDRLDAGKKLEDYDVEFLNQMFGQVQNLQTLAHNQPEIQSFAAGVVSFYHDLTSAALESQDYTPD